jgi:flagellar biogenesis protein FliO
MRVAVGIVMVLCCAWPIHAQEPATDVPTYSNADAAVDGAPDVNTPSSEAVTAPEEQVAPDPQEVESPPREDDWVEKAMTMPVQSDAGVKAVDAVNAYMDGEGATADTDPAQAILPDPSESLLTAFFGMLRGLAIVIALILIAYYLVRRFGKNVPALAGSQLGSIMGTIHLSKDASLHFVKTGGRILVIGANSQSISPIAEFDAVTFDGLDAVESASDEFNPDSFLAQLQTQSSMISAPQQDDEDLSDVEDDDIAALRGDIHRLQQYLREETRGSGDSEI